MWLPSLHVVASLHVLAWVHVVAFAAFSCLDCMRLPWLHVVGLAACVCLGCIRLPWLHVLLGEVNQKSDLEHINAYTVVQPRS